MSGRPVNSDFFEPFGQHSSVDVVLMASTWAPHLLSTVGAVDGLVGRGSTSDCATLTGIVAIPSHIVWGTDGRAVCEVVCEV
jgi:hypothetical protein